MPSDEEARAAARRIVREVLASREPTSPPEPVGSDVLTASDDTPVLAERGDRVDELVDSAVIDLVEDPEVAVAEPEVSEARARARALVAEVLAEHEAVVAEARAAEAARGVEDLPAAGSSAPVVAPGTASDTPDELPLLFGDPARGPSAEDDVAEVPPADGPAEHAPAPATSGSSDANGSGPQDDPVPDAVPESTARLQARELVAAVLAEAEAREAAAVADEEARAAAEAEAAAAREREEEAARELAAALAEETERAAWAEADRDVAAETVRMERRDPPPDAPVERTAPLSVAELAAAERSTRPDPEPGSDDGDAERTVALPVAGERMPTNDPARTQVVAALDDTRTLDRSAPAVLAAPDRADGHAPQFANAAPASAPPRAGSTATEMAPAALEATVDVDDVVERPRTGRWLLASVLGAVTLAIVFPLAIRALLDLVSLS